MNVEAERKLVEIRLRAECRAGELMKEMQKNRGGRPAETPATVSGDSEYRETIHKAGIEERTARRWQELAEVPNKK